MKKFVIKCWIINKAQKNLEKEMIERAKKYGVLDKAKENTETIIAAMLESAEGKYSAVIEWQE